jgi:hypothetical protein
MSVQEMAKDKEAGGLILDSLEVKNFRAFRQLTLPKTGRVNLITGKNNVGKTALLEALWIYSRGGFPVWLRPLLEIRNEIGGVPSDRRREDAPRFKFLPEDDNNITSIRHLFYGRKTIQQGTDPIVIGPVSSANEHAEPVSIALEWLLEEKNTNPSESERFLPISATDRVNYNDADLYIVVRIGTDFEAHYRLAQIMYGDTQFRVVPRAIPGHFVTVAAGTQSNVGPLWDNISLTPMEDDVVAALGIINPDITRVSLAGQSVGENRVPFVKIKGISEKLPLRTFGEGLNRLFEIALALTNATDGILLVDEVENGLHYSAQCDVWRFIFKASKKLNVQVFATTHSWDCIEAFQKAAAEDNDPSSGVLVRLENRNGDITSTVFDERRLAIVTRDGIEVR